jgi:RIO kinase 1
VFWHRHHTVFALEMAKDAFEDDDDVLVCSDSDIDDELDWLDSKKDDEYIKGSFSSSLRPNAHGGHHSYSYVLKPLSNRHHKFTSQIRASPLEVSFFQIHSLLWFNYFALKTI